MKYYPQRRWLRAAEKSWTRLEAGINRLIPPAINPLYHLGTLSVFLLMVLLVTGIYLTLLYRPNATDAYSSVANLSASWIGGPIRSIHRYASDALVVLLLLHALKMFLSERFWGSRWLSWVSGWLMLLVIVCIGAMGYWLVWDQRAQWLTDYSAGLLGGAVQLTFATKAALSGAFTFFVIILFIHIFLSVIILGGLAIHVLRLSRARLWSPRLLMIEMSLALLLAALLRPATSAPPADPNRLVASLTLDGWYLGFLPLAASWGSSIVWGISILIAAILLAIPWIARGKHHGPAEIIEPQCTGCNLCSYECPYTAIEMLTRNTGGRFETIATINPKQCTGCGICVGTCATVGVELPGLPAASVDQHILTTLAKADSAAQPVALFVCQRHAGLDTIPPDPARNGISTQLAFEPWQTTVTAKDGVHRQGFCFPVPCIGMVQPKWVRDAIGQGAQAVLLVGCQPNDCAFREGQYWVSNRLGRRRDMAAHGLRILHTTPGDRRGLAKQIGEIALGEPATADTDNAQKGQTFSIPGIAGVLGLILILIGLAISLDRPTLLTAPSDAGLRIAMSHPGLLRGAHGLNEGQPIDVTSAQALSGERLPVRLRLELDGTNIFEREYIPGGLRRDGSAFAIETLSIPPGSHNVALFLMEDGQTWEPGFEGTVNVEPGHVQILVYDQGSGRFKLAER